MLECRGLNDLIDFSNWVGFSVGLSHNLTPIIQKVSCRAIYSPRQLLPDGLLFRAGQE
jgi:hypothetical protein